MGTGELNAGAVPCDRLASNSGGSRNSRFLLRKLGLALTLGPETDEQTKLAKTKSSLTCNFQGDSDARI